MIRIFSFLVLTLILSAPALNAQTAELDQKLKAKLQTIKYLQSLHQADGGFLMEAQDPNLDSVPLSTLRATSAGVRSIKYLGLKFEGAAKTAAFVKSCYDETTGSFSDRPMGKGDIALTAVGLMAIVELNLNKNDFKDSVPFLRKNARGFEEIRIAAAGLEAVKEFPDGVKDWIEAVKKEQNADGTFGKGIGQARHTGGAVAMILRVGGSLTDREKKSILEALNSGQAQDGGYQKENAKGSDLETTYRVMRAFYLLKETPREMQKIRDFVQKCLNADGGFGIAPGQKSTIGSTYYAITISKWLDELAK